MTSGGKTGHRFARNLRLYLTSAISLGTTWAGAQSPDVRIHTDLRLHYRSERTGDSSLRWYDPLGRYSTVSVEFGLEPGFRGYLSERLQKIENNSDNDQLDEYYIEDPGLWKVGKQYLPFGRQKILRESARAARGDTNLILEAVPVSLAVCDNGIGRTRGVIARFGDRIGISAALGNNFGAQSTSLVGVRKPEDANGFGRGYRFAVGADFYRKVGDILVEGEVAALRNGQTALDSDTEISDLSFSYSLGKSFFVSAAWARDWSAHVNVFRAESRLQVYKNVFVEPMIRFKEAELFDAGISIRVRL